MIKGGGRRRGYGGEGHTYALAHRASPPTSTYRVRGAQWPMRLNMSYACTRVCVCVCVCVCGAPAAVSGRSGASTHVQQWPRCTESPQYPHHATVRTHTHTHTHAHAGFRFVVEHTHAHTLPFHHLPTSTLRMPRVLSDSGPYSAQESSAGIPSSGTWGGRGGVGVGVGRGVERVGGWGRVVGTGVEGVGTKPGGRWGRGCAERRGQGGVTGRKS